MKKGVSFLLSAVLMVCFSFGTVPITMAEGNFSPDNINGITAWYDADDLTLNDGAKVSRWKNKAGNSLYDALQSDSSSQPEFTTNGKLGGKAVRFSRERYLQLASEIDLDEMSVFAVVNFDSVDGGGDENQIFSKLGNGGSWDHNWYFNINGGGFNFGWKDSGGYVDYRGVDRALYADTSYILGGTKNGSVGAEYINGVKLADYNGNSASPAALHNDAPNYIGGSGPNGEDWSLDGDVCEIILYNRGLSEEEATKLNKYLAEKWGIDTSGNSVDGKIFINGNEIRPLSKSIDEYCYTVGAGETSLPEVTAEFDDTVEIVQPTAVPGTATVTVGSGASKTVYKIRIEQLEDDVLNLTQPQIEQVEITGGFWKEKLDLFRTKTVKYVLDQLESSGSVTNFDNIANGTTDSTRTSPWNDGLLFETIRGAADFLRTERNAEIEKQIDGYIDRVYSASMKSINGYLSTAAMREQPGKFFDGTGNARWYHDAYNFGCMTEAAVHYYKATDGSDESIKFLFVATRFAEFIADNYGYGTKADGSPKINMVPSHEGPEEMLLKLYELYRDEPELKAKIENFSDEYPLTVNENEYADLVKFWIENRGIYDGRVGGANYDVYAQDHEVYYNQTQGAGHAVRANLFYTGIAAAGIEFGDYNYLNAAKKLFDNITEKQMYVTGGVGAEGADEAYGDDYNLPNDGYCETCAQVAMGFFSQYMGLAFGDSKYADTVEKDMYNGVLGCIGENGESFFYVQPLTATDSARWDWIDYTPCCPPMFLKFYSQLQTYIYSYNESSVYVNQFVSSRLNLENGVVISQESEMPWSGKNEFIVEKGETSLHIRIPEWANFDETEILLNGDRTEIKVENGYAVLFVKSGDRVSVNFPMEARRVYNSDNVSNTAGMVSFAYGPLNYCFERVDNMYIPNWNNGEFCIGVSPDSKVSASFDENLLGGVVKLNMTGKYYNSDGELESAELTAIPFYDRANRGTTTSYVFVGEEPSNSAGKFKKWLAATSNTRNVGSSASAAFDGDESTAWIAGTSSYPQALTVDLGAEVNVGQVDVLFPSAQAWKYIALYSTDGVNWTQFADRSNNTAQKERFSDSGDCEARYIAIKLTESAGVGYASVNEISVFEKGGTDDIAIGKLCGASSNNEVGSSVFAMIDGNLTTRYCPTNENKPQWTMFDLCAVSEFDGVKIIFEKPSDWTYNLEISDDGINWNSYISETFSVTQDMQEKIISKPSSARYLRLNITGTTGGVWASVWEFDVLGLKNEADIFTNILEFGESAQLKGDIDGNGILTVSDVVEMRKAIIRGANENEVSVADMDSDGKLTVSDVVALRKAIMEQ